MSSDAVLVTGGTGLIGSALAERLRELGRRVFIASRRPGPDATTIVWDPPRALRAGALGDEVRLRGFAAGGLASGKPDRRTPSASLRRSDLGAIVNLAGESIAKGRWSGRRKEALWNSRIDATKAVVESLRLGRGAGKGLPVAAPGGAGRGVLVNASAVGYYGPRETPVDEASPPGQDFLARLCQAWEEEAFKAEDALVRVVCLRIGIVLARQGGALKAMLPAFRLGLGGRLGSGRQAFPWIHIDDVVGAILHALDTGSIRGPVNAVAPTTVTQGEFARTLGRSLHRPAWMPAPAGPLRWILGEMAEALLLSGQPVVPKVLNENGYVFKYPELAPALENLLGTPQS